MIIRSITLHITEPEKISRWSDTLRSAAKLIEDRGYRVWSKRISLPPLTDQKDLVEICSELRKARSSLEGVFVAAFNIDSDSNIEILDLVRCMEDLGFAFSSILVRDEGDIDDAYRKLSSFYSISRTDLHTRLALIYGSRILTPYFPASATIEDEVSFTVALRYAQDFEDLVARRGREDLMEDLLRGLEGILESVSRIVGVRYRGMDLSLSPWMDESVSRIVEILSGEEIPLPGTIAAIRRINRSILNLSGRVRSTGYNEIMLPVEEDSVLKERAVEGKIALRDLIAFSSICVAGVDMAVVPKRQALSGNVLRNIIRDLLAISETKGRPIGMRLILAEGSPGDRVDLGRFGQATIIRI